MDQTAQLRPGFFALTVRRHWRLIVVGAVLGLLAGFAALSQLPVTYTSQASLYLNPLVGNPYAPDLGTGRTDQLTALQTEAALVRTPPVAELAKARSTSRLPESPEDRVRVTAPSNTQVLDVSFTASSPAVAAAGAQAFADAYLEYRSAQAAQANAGQAELLRAQLASTATVIDDTRAQLADTAPGSDAELVLQGQLSVYANQQAQLNLALAEATAAVPLAGRVLNPASADLPPSGLPAWLLLAAALFAGTGLAGVLALAREHADDRVRDADELTAVGAGHPLAVVSTGSGSVDLARPSPAGYRLLLTGVIARAGVDSPVVCVLGINPRAAAEVAGGLAATAFRLGRGAVVLGIWAPAGWDAVRVLPANALVDPDGSMVTPQLDDSGLVVVPLDVEDDSAEEFVLSPVLPQLVNVARGAGSDVFFAGGTSFSAAGQTLAGIADITLVVVELGRDTFAAVVDVVETLREAGVEHIGLVVATPSRGSRSLFGRRGRAANRTTGQLATSRVAVRPRGGGRPSEAPSAVSDQDETSGATEVRTDPTPAIPRLAQPNRRTAQPEPPASLRSAQTPGTARR